MIEPSWWLGVDVAGRSAAALQQNAPPLQGLGAGIGYAKKLVVFFAPLVVSEDDCTARVQ